jgi:type I restriction enzyme, S subunit
VTTYSGLDFWRVHAVSWPLLPLRKVARLGTGHTPSRNHPEYWENCTIPWVTTEDLSARHGTGLEPLMDTRQRISELGLANSAAQLHPKDTVMLSRTASIGHVVRIGRSMATTQAFVTWTCGPMLNPRFLHLVLLAMKPEFDRLAYGSTHLTIYMPDIEQLRVPVPELGTQRVIANFLYAETARIDALIEKKRRMIHLARKRLSLLALETTQPADAPQLPLRRVVQTVKTGATPPTGEEHLFSDHEVPWFSPVDFDDSPTLGNPSRHLSRAAVLLGAAPRFPADSTLVACIGATAGRVAHLEQEGSGNQQLTCLVAGDRIEPRFLTWHLWSRRHELLEIAPRTTLPILSNEFLKSLIVAVPRRAVQALVVEGLEAEASRTRTLTQRVDDQIKLLREHRQALITAVVSGQLDVSKAAA